MNLFHNRTHYRKNLRVALREPVRVQLEGEESWQEAWTRDLSSGGMLLSWDRAPMAGKHLKIELTLEEMPAPRQLTGLIRRLRGDPESPVDARYLVAVNFLDLRDPMRCELREHVMRLINQIVEGMQEFPAFHSLSEFDLVTLASVCHRIKLSAGQVLLRQGDEARSLFIVSSGRVKLLGRSKQGSGSETVEIAGQGQIFGEVSTLTGLPHDLDIEALEDAELLALPRGGMDYLKRALPDTALRLMDVFMRFTGMRLRRMTRRAFEPVSLSDSRLPILRQ
ncbi:MAG: hypothetical protein CSA62_12380 [Planctomycetota bacterium]|nr:MAG: hypothetical protein CSA62_12380 [Planctomycetota bacterium]